MHTKIALSFLFLIIMSGCSLQKFALKTTTGLFKYGIEALYEEPDLIIAEQAIASNLKLLDGFYIAEPRNKELLLMLTQGYASYSLGFVEDKSVERAQLFYLRARDYGLDLLRLTSAFKDSIP
ncbi:MAG: TRAP transporter TatT component family protein, partial [Calditrichia bacterium]